MLLRASFFLLGASQALVHNDTKKKNNILVQLSSEEKFAALGVKLAKLEKEAKDLSEQTEKKAKDAAQKAVDLSDKDEKKWAKAVQDAEIMKEKSEDINSFTVALSKLKDLATNAFSEGKVVVESAKKKVKEVMFTPVNKDKKKQDAPVVKKNDEKAQAEKAKTTNLSADNKKKEQNSTDKKTTTVQKHEKKSNIHQSEFAKKVTEMTKKNAEEKKKKEQEDQNKSKVEKKKEIKKEEKNKVEKPDSLKQGAEQLKDLHIKAVEEDAKKAKLQADNEKKKADLEKKEADEEKKKTEEEKKEVEKEKKDFEEMKHKIEEEKNEEKERKNKEKAFTKVASSNVKSGKKDSAKKIEDKVSAVHTEKKKLVEPKLVEPQRSDLTKSKKEVAQEKKEKKDNFATRLRNLKEKQNTNNNDSMATLLLKDEQATNDENIELFHTKRVADEMLGSATNNSSEEDEDASYNNFFTDSLLPTVKNSLSFVLFEPFSSQTKEGQTLPPPPQNSEATVRAVDIEARQRVDLGDVFADYESEDVKRIKQQNKDALRLRQAPKVPEVGNPTAKDRKKSTHHVHEVFAKLEKMDSEINDKLLSSMNVGPKDYASLRHVEDESMLALESSMERAKPDAAFE